MALDRPQVAPLLLRAAATAGNVGRLRRELRQWLADLTDDPDVADDLCLAVSEALENAADHAFVGRPVGTVTLEAHHDAARPAVVVAVSDDGNWQPRTRPGYRGRGLALIEQLTSDHHLGAGPGGTSITLQRHL